ncbi:MAG TPA: cache domain-containing protein [Trebonia sp.]|nr:cache domain-containing protein [Trebonia sp.]
MGDLAAAGSRVRAVLEEVFGAATAIGDAFAAQRRGCIAAGAALTADRLVGLREIIWQQLGQLPAADGAGVVAAPGVIEGKHRHLEWWQRTAAADSTPDGYARIRLNLDPESIDLYDYLDMDWFTVPQREGRRYVYGPYVDFSGADRYVVTITAPVFDRADADGAREFLGIAGADIRMSHLEPDLLAILRSVTAPAVLVTAERRVVAANTAHWISGTRLDRLPAPGEGMFAAVTEVGADSGWLLAATSA